jgi:ABC-type multidrug transport system permease subunit
MKRYYFFGFPIDLLAILIIFVIALAALAIYFRKGERP